MALAAVSLDDKYTLEAGRAFMTGIQALVRLPIMQRQRDVAAGLNTAGFISGYRGSPLGGLDKELWGAKRFLERGHIRFEPGLNEDLAATAVWGSQQVGLFPGAKYDGVFAMWYGKGPGVDRSGDVFKHANSAGTARHGGVLVLGGDDHACRSSTLPHQSEYEYIAAMMPVLNPAGVQEILDYGIYGWALSRYAGLWVGFKCIAEAVESGASVSVDPGRVEIVLPEDFEMPPGGLNIRWPDPPLQQEMRLHRYKMYAALAFARANRFDRIVVDSPEPRLGIITTGKSYLDLRQALDDLGIDDDLAAKIGLRVYKVGMTWPLEPQGARNFAHGLEEIVVIEEKRAIVENQLKEQLYNWDEAVRPRIIGKFDEERNWILPSTDELTPARIARVLAKRIDRFYTSERIKRRLAFLEQKEKALLRRTAHVERTPHYCSGCPHNTGTRVPEGSRAVAGIGCHYMATWIEPHTATFTQMGGEGATWLGQAPFTETEHVFANLGDGTYQHSGILAIRAAVAANANITYKLLYNDAVAMTGGQPVEGHLTVPQVTHQLKGEGIKRIAVVADDPHKYPPGSDFASGVTFHHRDELDRVQRELREWPGVSVLIYDQTCAAEKRRRRKRGLMEDPPVRVFINKGVCEACGDCSVQSGCLSVVAVDTEYGRKRHIDQSNCNKDYSCLKGFCPSFVTVHGGRIRRPRPAQTGDADFADLPEPTLPALNEPFDIAIAGIGGTGVVTLSALLGMAAHLEGKGTTTLDQAGLAQKYGAVHSHVRVAATPEQIHAVRIAAGNADLLLGCDLVVAASFDALAKVTEGRTRAVVNTHEQVTGAFTKERDWKQPTGELEELIAEATGEGGTDFVDATRLATALLGEAIGANMFLLGYAYQKGLVPVSAEALERAIELNGVAVDFNKRAFLWGRRAAHKREATEALVARAEVHARDTNLAKTLDEAIERRVKYLTDYQDAAYAERYRRFVERVRAVERERTPGREGLTEAVARGYHKLLAYKDEYEVARLYTDGAFLKELNEQFEGDFRLRFHLAPPLFADRDPDTGHLKKKAYGPWMLRAFGLLARMKGLRGTAFDVFGYQAERRQERQDIADYEAVVDELLQGLDHDNHALAVEIASLANDLRGYGHIKDANREQVKAREAELLAAFRHPAPQATAAE